MKTGVVIAKVSVALFCSFHMMAIGSYAITVNAKDPVSRWFIENIQKDAKPYVLLTSQWQRWNLFSPDPLRRVAHYGIERKQGEDWVEAAIIDPKRYGFWRRASELKIARRLEDGVTLAPLRERYLQRECRNLDLPAGTELRLRRRYYVIPNVMELNTTAFWRNFQPQWSDVIDAQTTCLEMT